MERICHFYKLVLGCTGSCRRLCHICILRRHPRTELHRCQNVFVVYTTHHLCLAYCNDLIARQWKRFRIKFVHFLVFPLLGVYICPNIRLTNHPISCNVTTNILVLDRCLTAVFVNPYVTLRATSLSSCIGLQGSSCIGLKGLKFNSGLNTIYWNGYYNFTDTYILKYHITCYS